VSDESLMRMQEGFVDMGGWSAVDWVNVAVASRLQYEKSCGRSNLITEDFSRLVLAEAVQSSAYGPIDVEYNHPDLPGNCRLDLLVCSLQAGNITIAIGHKVGLAN
jgi:hypothetical protein